MENEDPRGKLEARQLGVFNADVFGRELAFFILEGTEQVASRIKPEALAIVFETAAEELLAAAQVLRSGRVR